MSANSPTCVAASSQTSSIASNFLSRNIPTIAALAAFASAFTICTLSTLWLSDAGAFQTYDRLFETDPNDRLGMMASGWMSGEEIHWTLPNSVHALLGYIFSIPIRIVAQIAEWFGFHGDPIAFRSFLALFLSPLAAGISASATSLIATHMNCRGWRLLGFNILSVACFSNMVFGSIPDHFAITRTMATLALLLLVRDLAAPSSKSRTTAWWILGIIASGITITNASLLAATRASLNWSRGQGLTRGALSAVTFAASTAMIAVVIGTSLHVARYGMPQPYAGNHVSNWIKLPSIERTAATIGAIGESFVPLRLVDTPAKWKNKVWPTIQLDSAVRISPAAVLLGFIVISLTAWGGARLIASEHVARWLGIAAALQFSGCALYFFWGGTPYLYSQHWIAGQLCLLLGLFIPSRNRSVMSPAIAGVALGASGIIASLMASMFIALAVLSPITQ